MSFKYFTCLLGCSFLFACKQIRPQKSQAVELAKEVILNTSYSRGITLPFQWKNNFNGFISSNLHVCPVDDSVTIYATDAGVGFIKFWNDNNDTFFKVKVNINDVPVNPESAYANRLLNQKLPPFELMPIELGSSINEKEFRGKISVINFWYNGCGWCEKEIPELNRLAADFNHQNVQFYSVCKDTGYLKNNKAFFADKGIQKDGFYIRGFDEFTINARLFINADNLKFKFNILGFPRTLVVDEEGIVRYIHSGYNQKIIAQIKSEILFLQKFQRVQ